MVLLFGPSAIGIDQRDAEVFFSCVGPEFRIYRRNELVLCAVLFEGDMRIEDFRQRGDKVYVYAENILKVVDLDAERLNVKISGEERFDDYVCTVRVYEEKRIVVLRHGQIIVSQNGKAICHSPPIWKIATSAYIHGDTIIYGDSFGTVSAFNYVTKEYFEHETPYGVVFGLDYDSNSHKLLSAHEYHATALWSVAESGITEIWCKKMHPSRVWGVRFMPCGPVSYGEDGCLVVYGDSEEIIDLHRTKNVSAVAFSDDEILTAGEDCVIRRFKMPTKTQVQEVYLYVEDKAEKERAPKSIIGLDGKQFIVSLASGQVDLLPSKKTLLQAGPWGQWHSFYTDGRRFIASSSKSSLLIGTASSAEVVAITSTSPVMCTCINNQNHAVIHADNTVSLYDAGGVVLGSCDLSKYIQKTPKVISMHPQLPVIAVGTQASKIIIIDFSEVSEAVVTVVKTLNKNGFQCLLFTDNILYAAGRSNGLVSVIAKACGEWKNKCVWRLPAGHNLPVCLYARSSGDVLVAAMRKGGVSLISMRLQKTVANIDTLIQRPYLSLSVSDTLSAAWVDPEKVTALYGAHIIDTAIGTPFHGLRGLSMASYGPYIATGACDRDIRVWTVQDGICCTDCVQAIDSGTHAIAFFSDGTVITGGSKEILFVWRLIEGRLFLINEINLSTPKSKCLKRITSLCTGDNKEFLIGMSDAVAIRCCLKGESVEVIEKMQLQGVPISMSYSNNLFSIVTSTGYAHFINEHNTYKLIAPCGLHRNVLTFENGHWRMFVAGDDGRVFAMKLSLLNNEIHSELECEIRHIHEGGIKGLCLHHSGRLVTFSYDQKSNVLAFNDGVFTLESTFHTPVSHGEEVLAVGDTVVLFGTGMHTYKV